MDFTRGADRQSTLNSTSSSSMSTDSKQTESEVLPEMQEKLKILSDGMDESLAEAAAYENEMISFLKELGLDPTSLPSDIREGLDKVCHILKAEGLTDMDPTTLEIHMQQKEIEAKKQARAEAEFKINYEASFKKYSRMQEKLDSVKGNVDSLEDKIQNMNMNYKREEPERLLILTKLNAYKDKVSKLEKQLEDLEIGELHPDIILKKSTVCMEKLSELAELNIYLSQYGDLPPNLLQAKAVLESKKKELEKLDQMVLERLS
ncbi:uncharacterized protein LOC117174411 [Belonocnema kinseyi]|uniref:uncharacterized protein LOC117174411 n=1 Tax=Belonocnema kinseyi TaxID=2817044 RepID=UPI00143DD05B|nr:uncharacterized protein LOC117174411 [Belonocnema kinseyi]